MSLTCSLAVVASVDHEGDDVSPFVFFTQRDHVVLDHFQNRLKAVAKSG